MTLATFTAVFDHRINNFLNYPLSIVATILSWLTYHDFVSTFPLNPITILEKIPRLKLEIPTPSGSLKPLWQHLLPSLLALVFTFILVGILRFADPIFQQSSNFLFEFLKNDLATRLARSIFTALYLSPLIFLYFLKPPKPSTTPTYQLQNLLQLSAQWASLFASIVYLIFLALQLNYLLFQHNPSIPGFTYSTYVKSGFIELILASVLTLAVAQVQKTKLSRLLTLSTLGLLLLNTYKLFLYIQFNGLTRIRILGGWFLLWLFILLLIQFFRHHLFAKLFLPVTFTILVLLNLLPTDNILIYLFKPTINGHVDTNYISKLDFNSYPLWPGLIENSSKEINSIINNVDVKDLTKDQFYKIYWDANVLSNIQHSIKMSTTSYGTSEQIANLLNDYWSIGDPNSSQKRDLIDKLLSTKTITPDIAAEFNLPPQSFIYKNLFQSTAYSFLPELTQTRRLIDQNLQKYNEYISKLPTQRLSEYEENARDH